MQFAKGTFITAPILCYVMLKRTDAIQSFTRSTIYSFLFFLSVYQPLASLMGMELNFAENVVEQGTHESIKHHASI
jgi:hypothetical protein